VCEGAPVHIYYCTQHSHKPDVASPCPLPPEEECMSFAADVEELRGALCATGGAGAAAAAAIASEETARASRVARERGALRGMLADAVRALRNGQDARGDVEMLTQALGEDEAADIAAQVMMEEDEEEARATCVHLPA